MGVCFFLPEKKSNIARPTCNLVANMLFADVLSNRDVA